MIDVGDFVSVNIKGRVAKKDDTGHVIRGPKGFEWISFHEGSIGRVVSKRRVEDKQLYKVMLDDGLVEFYANDLTSMRDSELQLSRKGLDRAGIQNTVSKTDLDTSNNAEY